jgi:glycerophosphoryl diester phosphodiesterase
MRKCPLIIAHRGASAYLPENTIPAFRLAFEKYKADMIEFDVHLTKDGVPVVIHDAKVNRTTNGRGYISKKRCRDIEHLDAGYYFDPGDLEKYPERGKGIKIPTLEEVLIHFPQCAFAVELKEKSEELTHAVIRLLKNHNALDRSIVGSKFHLVSKILRRDYPSVHRFCSERDVFSLYLKFKRRKRDTAPEPMAIASMPIYFMGIRFDGASWINFLHAKQIKAFFWSVPASRISVLHQRGADGLVLDDPGLRSLIAPDGGTAPKSA